MDKIKLSDILLIKTPEVTAENILNNSKASSGGERDVNFLKYLLSNKLLRMEEAVLKRTEAGINKEYYLERYKKTRYESDKHFLCRAIIQDELKKLGLDTLSGLDIGNMEILRVNSSYDIVSKDFQTIIDVGLTSARNYFRGLTDVRVKTYLIASYFDDYIDDIKFTAFTRIDDKLFLNAVKDYIEGFKEYIPGTQSSILSEESYFRQL